VSGVKELKTKAA